jgi:glycyl-tRNA synthetase beta chain
LFENAGLTEWPMPLLGRFDEAFLDVPPEVIQLTARVNQKYFVCRDGAGKLANAFVCVANIDASDGGEKIVEGNQKVLAARLSDARFFYETDLKTRLEELTPKLEKIVFHEKLGTVADKVDRVAKLARWLVEQGIVISSPLPLAGSPTLGRRIAPTPNPSPAAGGGTGQYGRTRRAPRQGRSRHRHGRRVPRAAGPDGRLLRRRAGRAGRSRRGGARSLQAGRAGGRCPDGAGDGGGVLADKLDTLVGFFAISERPSGSRDPFALRRAALGVIALTLAARLRMPLARVVERVEIEHHLSVLSNIDASEYPELHYDEDVDWDFFNDQGDDVITLGGREIYRMKSPDRPSIAKLNFFAKPFETPRAVLDFFADRLKVQQREAGVRHDLIDAVFALGGEDDLVRLLARVHALQAFVTSADGKNLLAGYKRAANILKKEEWAPGEVADNEIYEAEPAEAALREALDAAEPKAEAAIEAEDFEAAMAALATLRGPIDAFFETVTVVDPDQFKREMRLGLLARIRDAVNNVADFSKIEG